MTSSISLHGRVPVKATAKRALKRLVDTLQPDGNDKVAIEDGVLIIDVGNCDAPNGFHEVACQAVSDFCAQHATAGAIFDFDGSALVVGPTEQARKDAHAAYLVARIRALTDELERVLTAH